MNQDILQDGRMRVVVKDVRVEENENVLGYFDPIRFHAPEYLPNLEDNRFLKQNDFSAVILKLVKAVCGIIMLMYPEWEVIYKCYLKKNSERNLIK